MESMGCTWTFSSELDNISVEMSRYSEFTPSYGTVRAGNPLRGPVRGVSDTSPCLSPSFEFPQSDPPSGLITHDSKKGLGGGEEGTTGYPPGVKREDTHHGEESLSSSRRWTICFLFIEFGPEDQLLLTPKTTPFKLLLYLMSEDQKLYVKRVGPILVFSSP